MAGSVSVIVAAMAARRGRIIKAFQNAGAVDIAHACTLDELDVRDSATVRNLEREGVLVAVGPGYYLDMARFEEGQRRGRKIAVIATVVVFVVIVLALVLMGPR